ncbi:hypothetical protein [Pengzhenrongella phosphoraccumulans]|uniref:hypothetical protein n=1 Tax=Pengzhenrongella phosphoraccumulans TaxID=3114394 RepID=UPI00388DF839
MTSFSDPMDSANELADQVRALANATRSFEGKAGDTYWVLGSLLAANRRMQQVYAQLATAHVTHQDLAHTDAGNALEGRAHAHNAAMALRRAAALLGKVDDELGEASVQSGRIAWYPPAPPQQQRSPQVEITADGDGLDLGAHREAGGPGLND